MTSILSSVIAFQLINYMVTYFSAGRTLIFANLVPVISVLSGIVFMGDSFTPMQLIGVVIILLGVFGVSCQNAVSPK